MVEVKKLASSREELKANVLLVHGLGVGTKETWQTADKKSYLHEWLSASLPSVGIWQVDYDAAKTEWLGHSMALPDRARNILNALTGHDELVSKPLIIIAHSFGGLIVKSLFRSAETSNNSEYKRLLSNIKSVVFLGTPHSGAILASFGNRFSRLFRPSSASKTLNLDNPDIRELGTSYREITDRMDVVHLVFFESRPMKGLGLIVSAASADPGLSKQTLVAVDTDHVGLTHFKSQGSAEFVAIAKLIQATIEKSDVVPEILLDPITRGKTSNFTAGSSTRTRIQRQKEALLEAGSERPFNVLVCGVAADGRSPASKAATELARMLAEENFGVRIAGEAGLLDKEFYRDANPIQRELEYVKSECNAVVIIAEKADSWSELGLFGWHFATDRKLREAGLDFILLVDNQHKNNKYINDGPFSLIHAHGYAQYIDVTEIDLNLVVARLKSRRSVFTVDRRGRRKVAHD